MGAHPSAAGGMKALHVRQGLAFRLAERGHKFHRCIVSEMGGWCQVAFQGLEASFMSSP